MLPLKKRTIEFLLLLAVLYKIFLSIKFSFFLDECYFNRLNFGELSLCEERNLLNF